MSDISKNFKVIIRKAEKTDMLHVFEMIKELAVFGNMEDQVKIDQKVLERDGFSEEFPFFMCLIAELPDKTVIGYALYYYCYSWQGKSILLEDLYVKPGFRKKGVGRKLFLAILKVAHDSGLKRVDFHVLSWNPAIDFYKSLGAVNLSEKENWTLFRMDHSSIQKLFS